MGGGAFDFGLDECLGWPVRQEPPTVLEYVAAELWVREQYRRYFRERPTPQIVTWQLERFFQQNESGDPVIDLAMAVMEADFKQVFSGSVMRRYRALLNGNAPGTAILDLLKEASPGGALKPDMLGIAAEGVRLAFDAVEVGTVKTAKSTHDELQMKLKVLREAVIPQIKLRLPALQHRYATRRAGLPVPSDFKAEASGFRLPAGSRILPLPVRLSSQGKYRFADWICFHPSTHWRPSSAGPPAPGAPSGTDGLIIYHIHRSVLPDLPERVRKHVLREIDRWKFNQGLTLQLNPALIGVLNDSRSDWSPEAQRLFAYAGAGALLVMFAFVAVEVGAVAGAVGLADAGLAALAQTPAALAGAVESAGLLATRLWPAAVGSAPFVPSTVAP